jgi:tRNA threonylcarbamoyladenosine biosynthesis protein TsaB
MLLALDTATPQISLALHDGQRLVAEHTWLAANRHTVELAPQVAAMWQRAGIGGRDLRGIAVALGPGAYTGLRIGLGFAQGLALAHGTPLVGVSTFEMVALGHGCVDGALIALVNAGRGRVSAQDFAWGESQWLAVGESRLRAWAALAADLRERLHADPDLRLTVSGELDAAGRAALAALGPRLSLADPARALRRAGFLAEIGWQRLRAGRLADPHQIAPLYGQNPEGA